MDFNRHYILYFHVIKRICFYRYSVRRLSDAKAWQNGNHRPKALFPGRPFRIGFRSQGGLAGGTGGGGHRQKSRSESADFLNWSKPEVVIEGLDLRMQIHDMPRITVDGFRVNVNRTDLDLRSFEREHFMNQTVGRHDRNGDSRLPFAGFTVWGRP